MGTQIELFTVAIEHKEKALDAMRRFALPQAKAELQVAQEIDPSLADVKTLLQATEFLTELGLNAKVGLKSNYEQLDHVDPSLVLMGFIGF